MKSSPEREIYILVTLIFLAIGVQLATGFSPTFRFQPQLIFKAIIAGILLLGIRVAVNVFLELFQSRKKVELGPRGYLKTEILTLSTGGELFLRGSVLGGVGVISPFLGQLLNFVLGVFVEGGIRRSWIDGVSGGIAGILLGALYLEYRSLFLVTVASLLSLVLLRIYQTSPLDRRVKEFVRKIAAPVIQRIGRYGR